MKYWLGLVLFTIGCQGTVKTETQDQKVIHSGEAYTYVVVRFEFIEQVRQLCQDLNLQGDFESDYLWKKEIAECTFENLTLVNIDPTPVSVFENDYCNPEADLSNFTPQEQENIETICETLGKG